MLQLDEDTLTMEGMSPSCEHHQHPDKPQWHADGGERYIKVMWPCGHGDPSKIHVVCLKWLTSDTPVRCGSCPETKLARDGVTDLGPVTAYH